MKLLLDAHIVIWLISEPALLNVSERALVSAPDSQLLVSAVSIWEVRTKWLAARRSNRIWEVPPASVLTFAAENDIGLAPLTPEVGAAELLPAMAHTDPFDEMLLAHASALGAQLLTRDGKLTGHPLAYQP